MKRFAFLLTILVGLLHIKAKADLDYLIITSEALRPSFQALADHHTNFSGFTTSIITKETISTSYSGVDLQTKIRACIIDKFTNQNLKYVVLGGDDTVIPVRRCHVRTSVSDDPNMPTDLYYAGLDGNWDENGNGIYGQSHEGDLAYEVIVGRIPVRTAAQATAYINKVTKFNNQPPVSTSNKFLLSGESLWSKYSADNRPADLLNDGHLQFRDPNHPAVSDAEIWLRRLYRDHVQAHGWHASTKLGLLVDTITSWDTSTAGDYVASKENMRTVINQGWHFGLNMTHGMPDYFMTEQPNPAVPNAFFSSDAAALTGMVNFYYTFACNTGGFDVAEPSISEAMLRNPNGGSLVYLGSSRVNFNTTGQEWMESWLTQVFKNKVPVSGKAFFESKAFAIPHASFDNYHRWLMFSMNFQGDPAIKFFSPEMNSLPVAYPQEVTVGVGIDKPILLAGGDFENSSLTYFIVSQPLHGALLGTAPNLTYRPNAGYTGSDSFTFRVYDGKGYSPAATVSVTVDPATLLLEQNFDGVTAPALPAGWTTSVTSAGKAKWATNSSVGYSLLNSAHIASANNDQNVSALISPVVSVPLGSSELRFRHYYDTPVDGDAYTGGGGFLSIKIGTGAWQDIIAAGGSWALNGYNITLGTGWLNPREGQLAWGRNSGGFINTIVNLPASAAGKNVQFAWEYATDGYPEWGGATGWYVDNISISNSNPVNRAPVANAQSVNTEADSSKIITLTGSDADGDALTYAIVTQPSNGSLTGSPPNVTYTPNAGYVGADSFTFRVNDGNLNSAAATLSITVDLVTPTISAWPAASGIAYGQALSASTLTGGAASVAGAFAFSVPTLKPDAGNYTASVTFTPTNTSYYTIVVGSVNVVVAQNPTSVTTWPTASNIGQGQPLSASTLTGGSASVPGAFAFSSPSTIPSVGTYSAAVIFTPTEHVNYQTVSGAVNVSVLPVITPNNFSFETPEFANNGHGYNPAGASWTFGTGTGIAANGSPWFAASAPDGRQAAFLQQSGKTISQSVNFPSAGIYTITFSAIGRAGTNFGSLPLNVRVNGTTVLSLTTEQISTASWTGFIASPVTLPAGNHTIAFVNGTQTGDRANCIDNVRLLFEAAPNTAPVAIAQSVSTEAGTAKLVTLTGSDAENDQLTFEIVTQPANGSLSGSPPNVTYTPTAGYVGADSFTFRVNDGTVDSAAATVSITVNKATPTVSTWPAASGITYNQSLSAATLSGGVASVAGAFTYDVPATKPNAGTYSAAVTFTPTNTTIYNSVSSTVNVAVAKANPVITVLPTASDINYGQYFSASSLSGGTASTAGTFAFSGAAVGFTGQDAFAFRVSNGTLVSEAATVSLTINAPAATPTAHAALPATSTRSDGYTVVTFTENEAWIVPAGVTAVEVLVVGGGGGGGASISYSNAGGGGGGAGGLIHIPEYAVTSGNTIQVTVGAGGAPGTTGNNPGNNGQNSVFGELVALGGGGGSGGNMVGLAGGSGGGSRINSVVGGTGQQPSQPGLSGQYGFGRSGGAVDEAPGASAGGGGGAGAAGSGTTGGNGRSVSITGTSVAYAGGGGGGGAQGNTPGNGGTGGGGKGANDGTAAIAGSSNTGGGGGGGNNNRGGAQGGSGIVIVAYNDSNQPPVANAQSVAVQSTSPTAITLTGSDPNNDPLTFEIVTQPTHGTLSGTAPNVTYTPPIVPEPGVHPVAIIFTPSDTANYNSISSTVDVTVLGSISPYDAWAGPSGHNISGTPSCDDDGDGSSNFHEFAFGLNPTVADVAKPVTMERAGDNLLVRYQRTAGSELNYTVWASNNLVEWIPQDVTLNRVVETSENGAEIIEATVTDPLTGPALFLRVSAE